MRLAKPALWVCGCLGWAFSCGGQSEERWAPAEAPPVAEADFIPLVAAALCDIEACCSQLELAYDQAGCERVFEQRLQTFYAVTANTAYDPRRAGLCLQAFRESAQSCGQIPTDTICDEVVIGSLPEGAPCNFSDECSRPESAGKAYCVPGEGCVQEPRARLGAPCLRTCEVRDGRTACATASSGGQGRGECYLEDGLFCSDGVCEPVAKLGESCADRWCEVAGHCGDASVCVADGDAGARCDLSSGCAPGLFCAGGGECAAFLPAQAECEDPDACGGLSECVEGRCMPAYPSAEACAGIPF